MQVDLSIALIAVASTLAGGVYALSIARRRIAALQLAMDAANARLAEWSKATLTQRARRSAAGIKGHETRRQKRLGMPLPITENGGAE